MRPLEDPSTVDPHVLPSDPAVAPSVQLMKFVEEEIRLGRLAFGHSPLGRAIAKVQHGDDWMRFDMEDAKFVNWLADFSWAALGHLATRAELMSVVRCLLGRASRRPMIQPAPDELCSILRAEPFIATVVEFWSDVGGDRIEKTPKEWLLLLINKARSYGTLTLGKRHFPGAPNWLGREFASLRNQQILAAFGIIVEIRHSGDRRIVLRRKDDIEIVPSALPSNVKADAGNGLAPLDGIDESIPAKLDSEK